MLRCWEAMLFIEHLGKGFDQQGPQGGGWAPFSDTFPRYIVSKKSAMDVRISHDCDSSPLSSVAIKNRFVDSGSVFQWEAIVLISNRIYNIRHPPDASSDLIFFLLYNSPDEYKPSQETKNTVTDDSFRPTRFRFLLPNCSYTHHLQHLTTR